MFTARASKLAKAGRIPELIASVEVSECTGVKYE